MWFNVGFVKICNKFKNIKWFNIVSSYTNYKVNPKYIYIYISQILVELLEGPNTQNNLVDI